MHPLRTGQRLRVVRATGAVLFDPRGPGLVAEADGLTSSATLDFPGEERARWDCFLRDGRIVVSRLVGRGALLAAEVEVIP